MTNLTEVENYDEGVYQFELTDPIRGGADGVDNKPTKNLANRTKWLKAQIQIILDWLSAHIINIDPHTQYLKEADEPSQSEAESGTVTTVRAWSALRVKQAITAIAGSLISNHVGGTDPHTQYATKAGVQNIAYSDATASGLTTAYTASISPAPTALTDGMEVSINTTAIGTNTSTTSTFNLNSFGAYTIVKEFGQLRIADLPKYAKFKFDLTNLQWMLLNPLTGNAGFVASNIITMTGGGTIAATSAGSIIRFTNASNTAPLLPLANLMASGKGLKLKNDGLGTVTLTCSGANTITVNNTTLTSIVLRTGDSLDLSSDGSTTYFTTGGTAQFPYAGAFRYGAGWEQSGNGKIRQYGVNITDAAGKVTIVFATAFPSQFNSFIASALGASCGVRTLTSLAGITVQINNFAGAPVGAGVQVDWQAGGY